MWQFISQYGWIILVVGVMFLMHRPGGMHGGHSEPPRKKLPDGTLVAEEGHTRHQQNGR